MVTHVLYGIVAPGCGVLRNPTQGRWTKISSALQLRGLWTYDLRRTLACYLSNVTITL